MKTVISNTELKKLIDKCIDMICNPVISTLGPTGNNIIISNEFGPIITNDGVTIAKSISSEDKKENAILDIIKEATLKTNEDVGDGTTTTLVLLQSIYNNGVKSLENIDPIYLKKTIDKAALKVINLLNQERKLPTKKDLLKIATTSSNDKEIGTYLSKIYKKINNSYSIKIKESDSEKTYYETKKGYNVEIDIDDSYFKNSEYIELDDVYIVLINNYINNLEQINEIINESLLRNKNIIIFCNDYEENVGNDIILYNLKEHKNIYLIKVSDYGTHKYEIMNDISSLSNSKIINLNYDLIDFNNINKVNNVVLKKDEIIIISDEINNNYINKLKAKIDNKNEYEKDFILNRISKLENGITTIYVGGITTTEKREKIMRFEDALCSLNSAKKGICIGEGITFLKISNELNNSIGEKILKNALKAPFIKILDNSGINYNEIKKIIEESHYKKVYNVKNNSYDLLDENYILDSYLVLLTAFKNAVSIATMLLTTNHLIIDE